MTEYDTGDVVATPQGRGVVTAVFEEPFRFPANTGDQTSVRASKDQPAYVVGTGGASAPFRADTLKPSEFSESAPVSADGAPIAQPVQDVEIRDDRLPQGWSGQSLLQWWSTVGGTLGTAMEKLREQENLTTPEADRAAEDYKDMVLGTDRWRGLF